MKPITPLVLTVIVLTLLTGYASAQSASDDFIRPLSLEFDQETDEDSHIAPLLTNQGALSSIPKAHSPLSRPSETATEPDSEEEEVDSEKDSPFLRSVLSRDFDDTKGIDVSYCRFAGCCDCCNDPGGYKFSWAPDKWAKVGAAVRTSFNSTSATSGGPGNYFTLNNARLLTSGQVTEFVGFELNSDVGLSQSPLPGSLGVPSSYDLLDAIVKIETGDLFNVWGGQFLPPSDRANIDGPFFINGWDFPFVSNFPAVFQGRQIGAAYWGQWDGGRVKWSAGAFNGTGATLQSPYTNPPDTPPNLNHNIQFDARVTVNFLDPEPGYYHQSSYYGQKDILAVAFVAQTQNRATGTAANPAGFTGISTDVLFEKVLADNGVVTLEGALYYFNDQDLATSTRQGESGFVYAGYMLPTITNIGPVCGRWRPYSRYQQYNRDFLAPSAGLYSQGIDVGTEYVINGPNARITAVWSERDVIAASRIQIFTLAAQLVF